MFRVEQSNLEKGLQVQESREVKIKNSRDTDIRERGEDEELEISKQLPRGLLVELHRP